MQRRPMMKARMLHPSSGRTNFGRVSQQAAAGDTFIQASQSTHPNVTQTDNKKEIESQTEAAIQSTLASPSQGSSNSNK